MSKHPQFLYRERLLDFEEVCTARHLLRDEFSIVQIAGHFNCLSGTIDRSLWQWFGVEAAATRYKPDFES